MRNLTIKRQKSFVACVGKMKVYIEDPINGELQINGVNCRKLGELKNGEEQTFQVGTNAARIYVIADTLSKEFSNDYYPLPAGEEDVSLTGKNHYDLRSGNPFRFDGVTDEAALANRKKGNNKGIWILVIAFAVGLLLGFGRIMLRQEPTGPKDFSVNDMSITLTEAFEEVDYQGFTQCFESRDVAVFVLEEPFTLAPGLADYTLKEYGDLVVQANGLENTALKTKNGVSYFTYTALGADNKTTYYYFATVHKGTDAFWLVQFAVEEDQQEEYEDLFFQWADSVSFG